MAIADLLLGMPRSVSHTEAQEHARADGVAIYWRPGCAYCLTMKVAVRRYADRARWVNVSRDPDGAAFVRSVNHGDETVPTVMLGGTPVTNPSPGRVRATLADTA